MRKAVSSYFRVKETYMIQINQDYVAFVKRKPKKVKVIGLLPDKRKAAVQVYNKNGELKKDIEIIQYQYIGLTKGRK